MKVVILAGGFGSRLSEETIDKPKPMVEVGLKPIIWHIMKLYSYYRFNEFIICAGYKSNYIKSYFNEYMMNLHDITFDFKNNLKTYHKKKVDPWNITIVDTGLNTNTGGRIKKIKNFLDDDDNFFMTYGDGVGNINIKKLLDNHLKSNKIGTVTAVLPKAKYGNLNFNLRGKLKSFEEKPKSEGGWVNGGFFVLNKKIFKYIKSDKTIFEHEPLNSLVRENQLNAYFHKDFWQSMDTLRDKNYLNQLLENNKADWQVWKKNKK